MSSRSRRKPIAVLATVLVVGAVAACLMIRSGMATERKELRFERDPVLGCQYRFTVSSNWQVTMPLVGVHSGIPIGDLSLTAAPPTPFRQWMNDHLLRRSSSDPASIQTTSYLLKRARIIRLVNGYPEMRTPPQSRTLEHRHLRIDGYPATLSRWEQAIGGKNYQTTLLSIYFPESSAMYDMYGISDPQNADQIHREIQQIIASFHIEKVTGDKQGIRP
jgi:hypothetical protein